MPLHRLGHPIWAGIRSDSAVITLLETNGAGLAHEGLYVTSLPMRRGRWREHADDFADTLKIACLFSKYALDRFGGHYYAKAQNIRRRLRAAYDDALSRYDLLMMPTCVMKATPIPAADAGPEEITPAELGADPQYLPVQRDGPPGDQHPVRHGRRPPDRPDAGRPPLGRGDDLSRRRGVRAVTGD